MAMVNSDSELSRSRPTLGLAPSALTLTRSKTKNAFQLVQSGDFASANTILENAPRNVVNRDLLGVCLMRMGKIEDAVQLYRSLVLMPDSVQERPEIPDVCKRNFATALLMKGLPSGSLSVLDGLTEPEHAAARRIRAAIGRWEKTLSFWRWLDWKINSIEPPRCAVPIDFIPGELQNE